MIGYQENARQMAGKKIGLLALVAPATTKGTDQ